MIVSDYIFKKVSEAGVRDVFMVSGGGIMYLCEALGRNKDLRYWCNYNEQASATAAEGYARVTENLGVCLVTTGPGSTNALTGVASAWLDSIPMLVISGQVRTQITADYRYQRQVGPQEINIVPMAEPVTKYTVMVTQADRIRYELEKAIHLATTGRPGPVWLVVPLDVQNAEIDPDSLIPYQPTPAVPLLDASAVAAVAALIRSAKRPVLVGGNGVVLSGARQEFDALARMTRIPVMTTISGMDLVAEEHPQFVGRFGPGGQRRANFALQNADLLVAVGTSLSLSCIGFNSDFAPKAKKVLINIDAGDLVKRNIVVEHPVQADAKLFLAALAERFAGAGYAPQARWLEACDMWKATYPVIPDEAHQQHDAMDIYRFYDRLSDRLGATDIVVTGNSLDGCIVAYQALRVREGQRAFTSVCYGAMGWDLPAVVGATVAGRGRRGVLITGDGSIQFNIHELMVLGANKLNCKIFVSNNDGYQGIRNTQDRFFEGRYVGADKTSGVVNPDFARLAEAYGVAYARIDANEDIEAVLDRVLADDGPCLCELRVSKDQQRFRVSSYRKEDGTLASRPLEDMDPPLPREEVERNMALFDDE